jgi:hypothetical protein
MSNLIALLFFVLISVALSASATAGQSSVDLPNEWKACSQDADCELFKTECGFCSGGNMDYKPCNSKWKSDFEKLKRKNCPDDYPPNFNNEHEKDMWELIHYTCRRNMQIPGPPKCVNNTCQYGP